MCSAISAFTNTYKLFMVQPEVPQKIGHASEQKYVFFNYLDEEYLHMHTQVTTAVILAFFSPSCFLGIM